MELKIMTIKQALATKTKEFICNRDCKHCGSRKRYFTKWHTHSLLCSGCVEESVVVLSKAEVDYSVVKHNRKVASLKKKNWTIPVSYSGYNTVK